MAQHFGKYELLQRIGVGGMAEVFRARVHGAEGFVKEVVIKRILPAFTEDPDFVDMFIHEARTAVKLSHANIVQILDFDHVDGNYYIAMEWVDGADLRRLQTMARRRKIEVPATVGIHVGVEALKGLHYAHTREEGGALLGIVHRDISPHNLLVSFSGEVKVTDFGIAKVAALASATRPGAVKGKLTYMSPEQVRGGEIDHRSDLFSLGIVLWELFSGRRLYIEAGSEGELIAAVRRAEIPPLGSIKPDIPEPLGVLIERLLAVVPEQRYDSAAAALQDLSRLAGAGDELQMAEFVRRVLPVEAQREERGQTAQMVQPGQLLGQATRTSEPDAGPKPAPEPSGTGSATDSGARGRSGTTGPRRPDSAALPGGAAPADPEGIHRDTSAVVRPRRWPVGLAAVVVLVVMAAGAWFAVRAFRGSIQPVVSLARSDTGRLELRVDPPAEIEVDGVPLGKRSTAMVEGPGETRLRVTASSGGRKVTRDLAFPAGGQRTVALRIRRPAAPSQRPAPQPDAGASHTASPAAKPTSPDARVVKRGARRSRRPVRPRPRAVSAAPGQLSVVVYPWAKVTLDGHFIGTTPIKGRVLESGRHRLTLTNRELGKRETLTVSITPQGSKTIRRNWLRH